MRITESQLRRIVRRIIESETPVPEDAPPQKQVHVFDFDDTLGVTTNANGIMLYRDGEPVWQSPEDVKSWMSQTGISDKDVVPPGIKRIDSKGGYSVYVTSDGLAKAQAIIPRANQGAVYQETEPNAYKPGDSLFIDFSPSGGTNIETTKPIDQTIQKMKKVQSMGSDTMVLTARKAGGTLQDFDGEAVPATNDKDMSDFLAAFGAAPTLGVMGVVGGNKGQVIANKFLNDEDPPEEIHFYDDSPRNTDEVEAEVAEKYPSELFIYGPGNFDHGKASPNAPRKSFPAKEDKMLERWCKLAGIIKD